MERPLYINGSKVEGVDVGSGSELDLEWNEDDGGNGADCGY